MQIKDLIREAKTRNGLEDIVYIDYIEDKGYIIIARYGQNEECRLIDCHIKDVGEAWALAIGIICAGKV